MLPTINSSVSVQRGCVRAGHYVGEAGSCMENRLYHSAEKQMAELAFTCAEAETI